MTGTQLGHYRLERLLGSGGMGEVYFADDLKLGRRVALKILSNELAGDPHRRERFHIDTRGGVSNLMRQPIAGGPAVPLTKFTSDQIFGYAISPDQKQIAAVRGRVSTDVVLVSSGAKQ